MSNLDYSNDYHDEDMDEDDCLVNDDSECAENDDSYDDSMDGDHDSAMTSAGWGTDEDYGYYGNEED